MKPGSTAYLALPPTGTDAGTAAPKLLAGTVVGLRPGRVDLSLAAGDATDLAAGAEMLLHFDLWLERRFVQQAVRVEALHDEGRHTVAELALTSDTHTAERRRHPRVPALNTGASVHCEDTAHPLLDVSASGLAFVSRLDFAPGDEIEVALEAHDQRWTGRVVIRSRRALHRGNVRYGAEAVEEASPDDAETSIARGLVLLASGIERTERRRRHR